MRIPVGWAGTPSIVRIPRTVVRGANQVIFVDEDDRIRIRTVDIARADADFIYLRGGASPGDRIVLTTLESPINGTSVRTIQGGV